MILVYDGSFEGLLSCVFVAVKERLQPHAIASETAFQSSLLDEIKRVPTDDDKAARVLKGVAERGGENLELLLFKIFLSELPEREQLCYNLIGAVITNKNAEVLKNYANPDMLRIAQIEKMINREVHRMHAFVRFQKTRDELFYAVINPDFNVLPLIGEHFEKRYADQGWLIFDGHRHYGIYYDKERVRFVSDEDPACAQLINSGQASSQYDAQENEYQILWQQYFKSVNIQARNNKKLHLRHMPRRYWKYLTEKWV